MKIIDWKWKMTLSEGYFRFGKAKIKNLTFDEAVETILTLASSEASYYVVTPNVDHIVLLEDESLLEFKKSYDEADVVLADGMPIVWASKILGSPLKAKVSGSDITPALCKMASVTGHKIFLLGAADGVANIAANNLIKEHPGITIAGTYSPPMGFETNDLEVKKIVDKINNSQADLIFLAFNTIKQEVFMNRIRPRLKKGVMLGVGATIDFLAGKQVRAPVIMQKLGMEWVFRLAMEPKRMYKRYWRDLMFFPILFREFLQKFSNKN